MAGSAATLIAGGTIVTGLQFLMGVVLANALTKEAFGTYKQVYLLYGIVTPLFTAALPNSLLYFVPRMEVEERQRLVGQTLVVLWLSGLLLGSLLWLTANLWASVFSSPGLGTALRTFSIVPMFMMPAATLSSAAVAFGRARLSALASLLVNSSGFALVVGAALLYRDINRVLAATIVAAVIHGAVTLWVVRVSAGGYKFTLDRSLLRRQFAYALPLAVAGIVGLLAYQTDRMIISLSFSPAVFAVYVVGAVEVPLVSMIGSNINSVLMPRISELHSNGETSAIVTLYREAVRKTAVLVLPLFGYLMMLSAEFILFLYPEYIESVSIFRVYLLLLPLRVASYGLILQAVGRSRELLRGSVYYLIFNAATSLWLVHLVGLSGPAWGTLVSTVILAAWYIRRSAASIGATAGDLLPWAVVGALLACSVAAGGLARGIVHILSLSGPVALVAAAVVFVPLYYAAGRLTGGITNADTTRLRAWVLRALGRGRVA